MREGAGQFRELVGNLRENESVGMYLVYEVQVRAQVEMQACVGALRD